MDDQTNPQIHSVHSDNLQPYNSVDQFQQPAPNPQFQPPVPQMQVAASAQQNAELIARLKEAKNVLVTVSHDPSIDQLSAAIGLTIALNRMDKHATAVFSGQTPNTLEFLQPEKTLEKTTDSLRDFIIALDKSKADKLRYKVEDQVVRIFITPYHTALTESDLDFSQGDFNVDVVVALGVQTQQDIDDAVQSHGRILHDATVAVLSLGVQPELGTMNIVDGSASSLSEMTLELIQSLDKNVLDSQVATALLTGIVAMTERFSNDRTTPKTMSASATLMAAGANQQLITSELERAPVAAEPDEQFSVQSQVAPESEEPKRDPGELDIDHDDEVVDEEPAELPSVSDDTDDALADEGSDQPQIHVDENGTFRVVGDESEEESTEPEVDSPHIELKRERMAAEPSFDSQLSANTEQEAFSPPTEVLTQPQMQTPILTHNEHVLASQPQPDESVAPVETPALAPNVPMPDTFRPPAAPEQPAPAPDTPKTLADIEREVNSPHLHSNDAPESVTGARDAVQEALQTMTGGDALAPIDALNAQPLGPELHDTPPAPSIAAPAELLTMSETAAPAPSMFPGSPVADPAEAGKPAPPPVPPPMIPPAQ